MRRPRRWHLRWLTAEHGKHYHGRRGEAWASLELRQMNRLTMRLYWFSETRLAWEFAWENGGDPAGRMGVAVELPERVADWLGRHRVGS